MAELEKLIPGESCKGHLLGKSWVANTELFNYGGEVDKDWVGPIDVEDGNQAAGSFGCALTGHLPNPGDDDDAESNDVEMIEQQACKLSSVPPSVFSARAKTRFLE